MATPGQVYQALINAGATKTEATTLTAIAGAESGYNPNAVGDVSLETGTWGPSVGVFQIRTLKAQTGTGSTRDAKALQGNLNQQAKSALAILHGSGYSAWTTYSNGAYKKFLGGSTGSGFFKSIGQSVESGIQTGTSGADSGSGSTPGLGQLVGNLISFVFWERVLYILGGAILILLGVVAIITNSRAVRNASRALSPLGVLV